ncbi:MAG: prolipoprotein diacylglyceryl transferase [Deltaproteobacteria bacterium]
MHPILLQFGPIKVFAWGFMLALAVIISVIGISRMLDKEGYQSEIAIDLILLTVICGIIGGRLSYIITYEWTDFLRDPWMVLSLREGGIQGLVWYGSLAGGVIPFLIYLHKKKLPGWPIADIFAPFVALGYAVVRIGCFLEGCCYGKVTSSALGMIFPTVDAYSRYPTQLFSSALNFILFGILIWLYQRRRFPGQVFITYIIGYSIYRFIVEYFRESLIMVGPISLGQVYTLGLLIVGVILYYYQKSRWQKTGGTSS